MWVTHQLPIPVSAHVSVNVYTQTHVCCFPPLTFPLPAHFSACPRRDTHQSSSSSSSLRAAGFVFLAAFTFITSGYKSYTFRHVLAAASQIELVFVAIFEKWWCVQSSCRTLLVNNISKRTKIAEAIEE